MSELEKQEGQKTVVAFVAGLLVGGLLVWIFSSAPNDEKAPVTVDDAEVGEEIDENGVMESEGDMTDEAEAPEAMPELVTGEGKVDLGGLAAGSVVDFDSITFPVDEGWIAIRSYTDETLGNILGASRFSKSQGLVPDSVQLLAPTVAGRDYAVVFFTENGDRAFNLATDSQIEGVFATFKAE